MRFVPQRILRVLAVASVVYGVKAATEDHLQSTSMTRTPAVFADALGCLVDRFSSSGGGDPGPGTCYDMLLSFWNHVQEPHDNTVKERKKKGKFDGTGLLIGVGAKLILLLPILAVLIGKAVSLSFTSLLITALVYLHKT